MIARLADKFAAPALAKGLVLCAVALVLSIAANVWQLHGAVFTAGERAGELKTANAVAEAVGEVQALRESAETARDIASTAAAEQAELASFFSTIAEHARTERTVYKTRVERLPAPDCAPGPERMGAFNEGMRE